MQRLFSMVVAVSLMGLIAWLSMSAMDSYQVYKSVKTAKYALEAEVSQLRGQLEDAQEESQRLENDKGYYEQLGREELGMIRPDELVYIVEAHD